MTKSKTHENLTGDYFSICKLRKKFDFSEMLLQFSIISVLLSWKPAQIGLYKIAAPILLFLSIFYFFQSVSRFRRLEEKKSQAILDGFEIEKQGEGGRFFHDILDRFNLKQILLARLIIDFSAFGVIGYLTYQFLVELVPNFSIPRELLIILFAGAFSAYACKEYYEALKPLDVRKSTITSEKEESASNTLSDSERHRAQAIEYKKLAAVFKKNNMIGIIEMFASLGPLYYISKVDAPYVKPLGCLFVFLAIFLMSRDYMRSKNLDAKVVRLVMKGVDLEKKKPSFDRFFHNVLGEFSIVKILASRSLCTVICVYFLGSSMNQIWFGNSSAPSEHRILLGLIGSVVGIVTCILYYESYKKLDEFNTKT